MAGLDGPPGIYNISDDLPASQNFIVEYGSALLDVAPPPLLSLEQAGLSAQARAFYAENRRVANGKAKRVLRSEEHTSELQSLMRISYAVFCLKKKTIPFFFFPYLLFFSLFF